MPELQQGFTKNYVDPSDRYGKLYSNIDGSNMINFGIQNGRIGRAYNSSYVDHRGGVGGGGGIEFRADSKEESGVTSPPLWKSSPPKSPPRETTPLHSHIYNHHHYRLLSPTSRAQAIARGKEELMEMVKNMPESSYELSLKDIVENSRMQGVGQKTVDEERELSMNPKTIQSGKKKKKKNGKSQMLRSASMDNGPFLLKMFIPTSLGRKNKKSSAMGPCAKVSPRPIEGEKGGVDKDWWKKRFVVVGENENNGSSSIDGSSGSSNSNRSRNKGDLLPSCWSFLNNKNSKDKGQKSSLF